MDCLSIVALVDSQLELRRKLEAGVLQKFDPDGPPLAETNISNSRL
jgi:hypothetical protein